LEFFNERADSEEKRGVTRNDRAAFFNFQFATSNLNSRRRFAKN